MRPFLVSVALFVVASTTQGMEPRIDFAPRRALEAGEVVTVRWSGLPDGVEELEFLLRRDDGEIVRLTEQLTPSARSFGWVVPDLPSRRATLLLRAGIEGRGEITLAASEPFVIQGGAVSARFEFRNGEWWAIELPSPARGVPHLSFVYEVPLARALVHTRKPLLVRAHSGIGDTQPLEESERTALAANTRCGAPRTIPQRK